MLEMLIELRQVAESYEGNPRRQVEVYMDALKEYPHVLKLMCETIEDAQKAIRKVDDAEVRCGLEKRLQSLMTRSGYVADVNGLER
jgi:RNA binding exosome subunit